MGMLRDLFYGSAPRASQELDLYRAIVAKGREPHWYVEGAVPDDINGRFAVITGLFCMVLLRLEREKGKMHESVRLTEIFVDDMDGQLREIGIGDMIVGKHVGKMMGALGGRLGAYSDALASQDENSFRAVVQRNFYEHLPMDAALDHSADSLAGFYRDLVAMDIAAVMTARI